jgi:uncharacterized protein CA_P0160
MDSKGNEKNLKQCEAEEKLTLRLAAAGDIAFLLSRSDDGAITLVKEKTEEDPWTVYEFTMPASALTVNIGIAVNTVSINKQRLDIWEGYEETLTATVYPERLNDRSVRWEVEDTEIATVDRFGSVHGVRKGHTTVKAIAKADETKVAVCDVYVDTPQPLKSISFAVSSMKISFSKRPLQVLFTPRNFPNQRVTFSVKDSRIVSIDDKGYVKGLMKGKTEIYAESVANPSIKAKCTVEVIDEVLLTDIAFYKKQISLTVGATQKDLIDFTPLSATNKEVVWSIKDNSIVSVDRFGELSALRIGETEVSAQSVTLDKTITMKVIVTEFVRLESFSLSASSLKMKVGESKSLSVSFTPKNTTQRLIKWESSNAQV